MSIDEMAVHLYDLTRDELRGLAWEALLISDGPDRITGPASAGPGTITVTAGGDAFTIGAVPAAEPTGRT